MATGQGVGAHDAIKALTDELQFGGHHFVVEADIKGFFDNSGGNGWSGCWSKESLMEPF